MVNINLFRYCNPFSMRHSGKQWHLSGEQWVWAQPVFSTLSGLLYRTDSSSYWYSSLNQHSSSQLEEHAANTFKRVIHCRKHDANGWSEKKKWRTKRNWRIRRLSPMILVVCIELVCRCPGLSWENCLLDFWNFFCHLFFIRFVHVYF